MSANTYRYSYSGADATTLVWFDQKPELISRLSSVHTISVSVHESKGQARALGHRGIKGLARGVRTIAGSLIVTVINDHPLRELIDQYNALGSKPQLGWSVDRHQVGIGTLQNAYDYTNRLAVLLPPFNLAVQYVSELSQPADLGTYSGETPDLAGWRLQGVEFLDEGQVTSVNDIVTEMTFSFIACDFNPWSYTGAVINESARVDEVDIFTEADHQQIDSMMSSKEERALTYRQAHEKLAASLLLEYKLQQTIDSAALDPYVYVDKLPE